MDFLRTMLFAAVAVMTMGAGALAAAGVSQAASDAAQNGSEMMNPEPASSATTGGGDIRVLFLGNSITLHPPLASVGWTNNWGMAASAPEMDYVHLVTRGIEAKTGRKAAVRVRNLADFERDYRTWSAKRELAEYLDFDPDYLVLAIGENVPGLASEEDRLAYRRGFARLLGYFMDGRMTRPNTVVRGVFWPNDAKDFEMAHAASDYAVPFVRTADIFSQPGSTAQGLFAHGGVASHPGDKGMAMTAARILEAFFPTESGFRAWRDGKTLEVRPIRVSAMPFNQWAPGYQRPVDQTEIAGMIRTEAAGPLELRVRPERAFTNAVVRPLRSKVVPQVSDGEIRLALPGPGSYVLELDGQRRPLEIFVDPERDFAAARKTATVVFGPGLHEPKVVRLRSHDRVFLDRDAVVLGSFQMDGVEDVKITGYGTICGSRNRRVGNNCYRLGMAPTIRIMDSKNIVVDGPVVLDSACWMVEAFNSMDIELAHLKVTGAWRYNTDGIDICNSQRVTIRDSFIHSFDDTIVLKGIWLMPDRLRPVEDIRVERCVCWCGWGRTLEIGYETWAPYYRNILFQDCDLIHNNMGALSVHLGGPAPVEDVTYRDIRIEYDASDLAHVLQNGRDAKYTGSSPFAGPYFIVENGKMFAPGVTCPGIDAYPDWAHEPFGTVGRLTLENIAVTVGEGARTPPVVIAPQAGSAFGKIEARHVTVNGVEQKIGQ